MEPTPITAAPVRPSPRFDRSALAAGTLALLPVAAAVVFLVLHAMGAAAGATGGCGGG
ncbi:MAG TPA: hypothetical protein VK586_22690 [Streptosporangiaceae bacterium]|nr:hypothetical protein [Streptosporangiaceae bacterium]